MEKKQNTQYLRVIRRFGNRLLDAVYPRRCPVCDGILLPGEPYLCTVCAKDLKLISGPRCAKCGKPLAHVEEEYCRDCQKARHVFLAGTAAYLYRGGMQESLLRFKYHGRREYAGFYARSICINGSNVIRKIDPQVLIPVPVHPSKFRKRGYNQAEVLAAALGRELGIPVDRKVVRRVKNTRAQKELTPAERKKNLADAFAVYPGAEVYERILIVDDIYTTGSTVDAIAGLLQRRGAKKVGFAAVAIGRGES